MPSYKYDFGMSFSTKDSEIVLRLCKNLEMYGATVFVFFHQESALLGRSLSQEFTKIFSKELRFFLPIISSHYIASDWTRFEFDVAMREKRLRQYEYILPIRIDDSALVGASYQDVGQIDLRRVRIEEAARLLIGKLAESYPDRSESIIPHLWIASFGLIVQKVVQSGLLPRGVPTEYASLCDWLDEDLASSLTSMGLERWGFTESDDRDGESLAARIAFQWDPSTPLPLNDVGPWKLLELEPFEDIYPGETNEWLLAEPNHELP